VLELQIVLKWALKKDFKNAPKPERKKQNPKKNNVKVLISDA